jgi:hypothetical protein
VAAQAAAADRGGPDLPHTAREEVMQTMATAKKATKKKATTTKKK